MLNISKTMEDGRALFLLEGRLDTTTSPELEKELKEVLPDAAEITLDLEKLDYISSAGLRVLLLVQKSLPKEGRLRLIHVCEMVMDIFEMTGLAGILNIE